MAEPVALTPDGERVLREAQTFCARANVAIVGAEHVLAGALLVLSDSGNERVPNSAALESGLMLTQGTADVHQNQVMFGSAARDAINGIAGKIRLAGGTGMGALELALGTIDSGEVNPMFYGSLNTTKAALRAAISPEYAER